MWSLASVERPVLTRTNVAFVGVGGGNVEVLSEYARRGTTNVDERV